MDALILRRYYSICLLPGTSVLELVRLSDQETYIMIRNNLKHKQKTYVIIITFFFCVSKWDEGMGINERDGYTDRISAKY